MNNENECENDTVYKCEIVQCNPHSEISNIFEIGRNICVVEKETIRSDKKKITKIELKMKVSKKKKTIKRSSSCWWMTEAMNYEKTSESNY